MAPSLGHDEPKPLFPPLPAAFLCLLLGLLLVPLLLTACSSGATSSAYAKQAARATKTWTPLATLTPLPTYTPSATPPPTLSAPPVVPTLVLAPTIPPIGAEMWAQLIESRRREQVHPANVAPLADEPAFGGYTDEMLIAEYDGAETECCDWPVNGRITSNVTANHIALDIATTLGTPVLAADGGRVVAAGWDDSGYGYRVIVDHGDALQTLYAHLSNHSVEVGDEVLQGEMIGQIGSTGNSSGPHLHFEVRYHGRRITPWDLLP